MDKAARDLMNRVSNRTTPSAPVYDMTSNGYDTPTASRQSRSEDSRNVDLLTSLVNLGTAVVKHNRAHREERVVVREVEVRRVETRSVHVVTAPTPIIELRDRYSAPRNCVLNSEHVAAKRLIEKYIETVNGTKWYTIDDIRYVNTDYWNDVRYFNVCAELDGEYFMISFSRSMYERRYRSMK